MEELKIINKSQSYYKIIITWDEPIAYGKIGDPIYKTTIINCPKCELNNVVNGILCPQIISLKIMEVLND